MLFSMPRTVAAEALPHVNLRMSHKNSREYWPGKNFVLYLSRNLDMDLQLVVLKRHKGPLLLVAFERNLLTVYCSRKDLQPADNFLFHTELHHDFLFLVVEYSRNLLVPIEWFHSRHEIDCTHHDRMNFRIPLVRRHNLLANRLVDLHSHHNRMNFRIPLVRRHNLLA